MTNVVPKKSWAPTRKWYAALVGAVTPILLSGFESGFDLDTEGSMAVTAASALALAYIWSNNATATADGVPPSKGER